jgi:uncharacterized radical SAM protein YgiQ
MYRLKCKDEKIESACRRLSCVYPGHLREPQHRPHAADFALPQGARCKGVKKVLIGSGLRYDLAVRSIPEYVKELVTHHVGGYLKIAPEHTEEGPLSKMMKPGMGAYDRFKQLFELLAEAGKEQYLIPYFIAAHPGTTDEDMLNLALWLKRNNFRLDQVQTFLPTPMALATTMYHTERNPLQAVTRTGASTVTPCATAASASCTRPSCAITIRKTGRCCAKR